MIHVLYTALLRGRAHLTALHSNTLIFSPVVDVTTKNCPPFRNDLVMFSGRIFVDECSLSR